MRIKLLLLLSLLAAASAHGQSRRTSGYRDSIMIREVMHMQASLGLTDAQVTRLVYMKKKHSFSIDSVNHLACTPEQHRVAMQEVDARYMQRLQQLLTPDQYTLYHQRQDSTRARFMTHNSSRIKQ